MSKTQQSIENLLQQLLDQNQPKGGKAKKDNPKELLLKLATEGRNLYYDRNFQTYIEVSDENKFVTSATYLILIESSQFDRWILSEAYKKHNLFIDTPNLLKTIKILASVEAQQNGTLTEIHNRIAAVDGAIYIDIGSKDRKVIRIDKQGWNLGNYPVFFKRHKDMADLPIPERGGQLQEIIEFMPPIPVRDQCLALSWLIASFFSEIERAFLFVEGENGTGKTTLTKLLKSFIDPAQKEALTYTDNVSSIAQILDHHCLPLIDNVTKISQSVSDLFCTAYSGASYSKRKQYTDDEDFIFTLSGNVIFTTVHMTAPKSDFLNRCYKITTEKQEESYRSKLLFEKKFEVVKGRIFGAILDCVVKTMSEVEKLSPITRFRTVDFDHYASCAAEVMGYGKQFFWEARQYSESIKKKGLTNSTPIILALSNFLKANHNRYFGPIGKLLQQLPADAQISGEIPNKPNVFARRLNELRPELIAAGITVTRHPNGDNGSSYEITLRSNKETDENKIELVDEAVQSELSNSISCESLQPLISEKFDPCHVFLTDADKIFQEILKK